MQGFVDSEASREPRLGFEPLPRLPVDAAQAPVLSGPADHQPSRHEGAHGRSHPSAYTEP